MDEGNSRLKPFPTTQWSLIVRAAAADPVMREKALTEICTLYWAPVYAFIRSRGNNPSDAEDLTQGLFAELLERGDFSKADPRHGRLRSYLLTAAKNHLNSAHRREHRIKRGGHTVLLSIDAMEGEKQCVVPEQTDDSSPDRLFDRQWAITMMEAVVNQLAKIYEQKNRPELFEALRPFIQVDLPPENQRELAAKLNMTDQALRVSIHRLRQRYAEILRQTVKSTLGPDESVETELQALLSAF